jgi:hypothetical protein
MLSDGETFLNLERFVLLGFFFSLLCDPLLDSVFGVFVLVFVSLFFFCFFSFGFVYVPFTVWISTNTHSALLWRKF